MEEEEEEENSRHDQTSHYSDSHKHHLPHDMEKQISVDPLSLPHSSPPTSLIPPLLPSMQNIRRKQKTQIQKPYPAITPLNYRHSTDEAANPDSLQLRRSKSCGDGRASAPSDEFDIMPRRSSNEQSNHVRVLYRRDSSSDETEEAKDDTFKCGALCLFISKKKPAAGVARRRETERRGSFTASMERFECGSWSSPANGDREEDEIDNGNDESGAMSYFDLPLELIRCSGIDTCSPVKAGFVFDKDLKGVLKKSCDSKSGSRKSCDSTRHVRFSASAPTSYPASPNLSPCITPRLMRAREEFNALLEASSH